MLKSGNIDEFLYKELWVKNRNVSSSADEMVRGSRKCVKYVISYEVDIRLVYYRLKNVVDHFCIDGAWQQTQNNP